MYGQPQFFVRNRTAQAQYQEGSTWLATDPLRKLREKLSQSDCSGFDPAGPDKLGCSKQQFDKRLSHLTRIAAKPFCILYANCPADQFGVQPSNEVFIQQRISQWA